MKTKLQLSLTRYAFSFILLCLIAGNPSFANNKLINHHNSFNNGDDPANEEPVKKKKIKNLTSRKNNAVKLYMEIEKKNIHVVAKKNNDSKVIDFFVFDLEGTLMQNYRMKAKEHKKITGLKKGTYIFRVFSGDEETTAGEFVIN